MRIRTKIARSIGVLCGSVALVASPYFLAEWIPWLRSCTPCLWLVCVAAAWGLYMSVMGAVALASSLGRLRRARRVLKRRRAYKALRLPHFDGFPYLVTYIVPTFYHVILLPSGLGLEDMKKIAARQATANRLQTCLVLGEESCVYFGTNGSPSPSGRVPGCSFWVADKLLPGPIFIGDEELRGRKERLRAFIKARSNSEYLMGDLTKGGRPATEEELAKLSGFSADGVPKGLSRCAVCGMWRGECLDPNTAVFKDKIMKVHCRCQNDSLCARCGKPLYEYKLNANYLAADGQIWHVPGFCGFEHRCADEKEDDAAKPKAPFGGIELSDEHPPEKPYGHRFECSGGLTFDFTMGKEGLTLYLGFERYKDADVLARVAKGDPVEELMVLWELAHLPSVRMFTSGVGLGERHWAQIIESVSVELWRAPGPAGQRPRGVSEGERLDRLVKLDDMRKEAYGEMENQRRKREGDYGN